MSFLISKEILCGHWDHDTLAWKNYATQHDLDGMNLLKSWQEHQRASAEYPWERFALSTRLASVAELCPPQSLVVDIGTDHARLPLALLRSKKVNWAAGIDIHIKPLDHTRERLKKYQIDPYLQLIQADGFQALDDLSKNTSVYCQWPTAWYQAWHEHNMTATICGMGGQKALQIIKQAPPPVTTIIIQANTDLKVLYHSIQQIPAWNQSLSLTLDKQRLFVNIMLQRVHHTSFEQCNTSTQWYLDPSLQGHPLLPIYLYHRQQKLKTQYQSYQGSSSNHSSLREKVDQELSICTSYLQSCFQFA